jgi:hypothetical protein
VSGITDILNADLEEMDISAQLNDYIGTYLQAFPELYIQVMDKLAAEKIISKSAFKRYLKLMDGPREH